MNQLSISMVLCMMCERKFNFSLLDSIHIISKLNGNVAHTCTTEILQKTYELSGFVVKGVEKPLG